MKIHPILIEFNRLPYSIKNTAKKYIEGRNILIYCLARNTKRTEKEVLEWLKENKIFIKDLDGYILRDD